MKSQVLHTVWCNISGEAAGDIWHRSFLGVKGLTRFMSVYGTRFFPWPSCPFVCASPCGNACKRTWLRRKPLKPPAPCLTDLLACVVRNANWRHLPNQRQQSGHCLGGSPLSRRWAAAQCFSYSIQPVAWRAFFCGSYMTRAGYCVNFDKSKPGTFIQHGTLQCKRFGGESVSYSEIK